MLNKCVLTDKGKSFVREHEKDSDAQVVYRKLLDHANKSTSAELAKDNLIQYLTTVKLDLHWTGTMEGFILHWREQMRQLEEMLPIEQHYYPEVKKRMLVLSSQPARLSTTTDSLPVVLHLTMTLTVMFSWWQRFNGMTT